MPITALTGTGLSHAGVVRTAKIATLVARLATRIGALTANDRPAMLARWRAMTNALEAEAG